MYLGVDYYPEQWDDSLLEEDLDRITELGCNVIRIAEFSWHLMEKEEGRYDFSFFDHVIDRAKEKGLRVILGTPTATIPAWLAKKDPSILSEFENGQKRSFGGRHVHCYHALSYQAYSEKIVHAMAEHYKHESAVAAWQIDNEIGHEGSDVCFCGHCRRAFQEFLQRKFHGDIEALNRTYGTTFWSQEYNSFDEIPTPTATVTTHNPALRLDWERFRSQTIQDFMESQAALLREIIPDAVILHDFPGGGLEKHVDYSVVSKCLDVVAYNNYPVWGGQREPLAPHEIAFGLDYIRGLKRQNFWVTEAIMGAQGHDVTGYSPRPDQAKLWAYQAFAHGCDSMLFFRYRGGAKGAEQFCYGVLDTDNIRRRKFYEVQDFFREIAKYGAAMEAPVESRVAIVYDYDSLAAFRIQRQSILLDIPAEMKKLYKFFFERNISVDVIPGTEDFAGYEILLLPQIILAKPEFQERVKKFAQDGGTVVLTYRSAVKDENNNLVFGEKIPLGYQEFAGVTLVETESLQEGQEFPVRGVGEMTGKTGKGGIFREMLENWDAEVLYRYDDMFYREFAAVTRKRQGAGFVYYIGCGLEEEILSGILELMTAKSDRQGALDHAKEGLSHGPDIPAPGEKSADGVEIVCRGKGENRVRMMMNHNGHEARCGERTLKPYETVLEKI